MKNTCCSNGASIVKSFRPVASSIGGACPVGPSSLRNTPTNAFAATRMLLRPAGGTLFAETSVSRQPPSGDGPTQNTPVYDVEPVTTKLSVLPAVTSTSTGEL